MMEVELDLDAILVDAADELILAEALDEIPTPRTSKINDNHSDVEIVENLQAIPPERQSPRARRQRSFGFWEPPSQQLEESLEMHRTQRFDSSPGPEPPREWQDFLGSLEGFGRYLFEQMSLESSVKGITKEQFDRLDHTKVGQTRCAIAESDKLDCVVCMSRFVLREEVTTLPCKHTFHRDCMERWLIGENGTCPCCRTPVAAVSPTSSQLLFSHADIAFFERIHRDMMGAFFSGGV
jgi:hypothetical protein